MSISSRQSIVEIFSVLSGQTTEFNAKVSFISTCSVNYNICTKNWDGSKNSYKVSSDSFSITSVFLRLWSAQSRNDKVAHIFDMTSRLCNILANVAIKMSRNQTKKQNSLKALKTAPANDKCIENLHACCLEYVKMWFVSVWVLWDSPITNQV